LAQCVAAALASSIKYRPDIDGLRAVAVLPVVAYHLGFRPVTGGFVGVDVFFVISGFLIGSMVFADIAADKFSLTTFYVRRIRRIFPALFTMMAATAIAAYFILYPAPFIDFGKSLAAATFSVSNFYFWATSGYFDAPAITKPLLHTWSLAVEEQFYLLFPPLALALHRWAPRRVTLCIIVIALISLVWSAIGVFVAPNEAFYLLHTRAWELALGILLARGAAPKLASPALRTGVAAAGLALIVGSVFLLTRDTPFPGLAAIPPCLGAAMLIAAGGAGDNPVSRLLSWKPIVFIGLISYSLYLWHWPIIVLYQQYLGSAFLFLFQKLQLAALMLVLSVLSWRFIEQPFRRLRAPAPKVLALAGGGAGALMALSLGIVLLQGAPQRFAPDVMRLASYLHYEGFDTPGAPICFIAASQHTYADYDRNRCLARSATRPNILLLGDSHAAHLRTGLIAALPDANVMQATASGCKPLLHRRARDAAGCRRLMQSMFEDYLPNTPVDLVIVSARWFDSDLADLASTLDYLKARHVNVLLVGPIVQYNGAVPQLVALAAQHHDPDLLLRQMRRQERGVDAAMAALAARKHVRYASAYRAMCPGDACVQLSVDGVPLQHDYGHLTREGSIFVVDRLRDEGDFAFAAN
jgi:peptidoglycan/LPS O-acetylase OafA/YrhL